MIRMIQISTAKHAQSYFAQDLRGNTYYNQGITLAPEWGGQTAARLGLTGAVQAQDFNRLCNNRHPETAQPLTPRTNKKNRTVAYDLNFHPPKSVSLMLELTDDRRLEQAFREAVTETLQRIENELQTRVRLNRQTDGIRTTANACYALFYHHTARPINGQPDPHLHAHALMFNVTYDPVEDRLKAAHFRRTGREMPYYQACFHASLCRKVSDLGYPLRQHAKGWEIAGIPETLLRRFSRRTVLIEQIAAERRLNAPAKNALGAQTREAKIEALTRTELRIAWRARITDAEYETLQAVRHPPEKVYPDLPERETLPEREDRLLLGQALLQSAIDHHFERETVVAERRLQTTALRFGRGQIVAEDLPLLSGMNLLLREHKGQRWCTTPEALQTETQILQFVRAQKGKYPPAGDLVLFHESLNEEQGDALNLLLRSRDGVLLLEGKAGTGKTTLLNALRQHLEAENIPYHAVAPTAEASREVLRNEGFPQADTLAAFLTNPEAQRRLRGGLLLLDEAGMAGTKTLLTLCNAAERHRFRILLCGDRAQHSAVERGGILPTLVRETGLRPATLYDIRRQSGAYRQAVQALSQGHIQEGFQRLEQNGCIREIPDLQSREQAVVQTYLRSLRRGESVLIVAPTHAEGQSLTAALRQKLRQEKILKGRERLFERLVPTGWTEAQRKDGLNYEPGMVIEMVQNAPGYRKGQRLRVAEVSPQGTVYVWDKGREGGNTRLLDLRQAVHFKVCRTEACPLRVGDRIRIAQNGKSADGTRLTTGSLRTVREFDREGNPVLDTGVAFPADYGHWSYGYVSTSHASQGKTCDHVIICQSEGYGSAEQFYVSVSRGRKQVTVFTGDKEALKTSVLSPETRMSATALLRMPQRRKEEQERRPAARPDARNTREQLLYENTARTT